MRLPFFITQYYSRGGQSISEELRAALDRAESEEIAAPDAQLQKDIDAVIKVMKSAGAIPDRLWLMGYNDTDLTDFSRISLFNSETAALATLNNVAHVAGGWQGNGTTGYADTGFVASTHSESITQNAISRAMWVYASPSTGSILDGTNGPSYSQSRSENGGNLRVNSTNSLSENFNFGGTGYRALNRSNADDIDIYVGSTKTTRAQESTDLPSTNQLLFRQGSQYSNAVIAAYAIGPSWTEQQHNAFAAAIQAFLTARGL